MLLRNIAGVATALAALSTLISSIPTSANAQSTEAAELPELVVEGATKKKKATDPRTRLTNVGSGSGTTASSTTPAAESASGDTDVSVASGGITGASTTVITREQIARSPQTSLAEIVGREAGVQVRNLFGSLNGAGSKVDLRGFGASAPNNTLLLINGRRQNDWDLDGFDLSTIAKDSIERIEITRGNSGAVLYGEGAVGGVINIVTKSGVDLPTQAKVEGGLGSLGSRESVATASASSGPFSAVVNGSYFESDGYRVNNEQEQSSAVADLRWSFTKGSVFLNLGADDQKLRLPGGRRVDPTLGLNEVATDPKGTSRPLDYGDKQGVRLTTGFSYRLTPDLEIIVDGGIRTKWQQGSLGSYVDSELSTTSLTPRVNVNFPIFGLPSRGIAGVDIYDTEYTSARSGSKGAQPFTFYDAGQKSVAAYWQQTVSIFPTTDLSAGGRIQRDDANVEDTVDTFDTPFDEGETNHAWHVGAEQRIIPGLAAFGRLAESFRVPNVDERTFTLNFGNYDLRTQTSQDWEIGARVQLGGFRIQSSYYDMDLTNELFFQPGINCAFGPCFGANVNLDPTRRRGVETIASLQLSKEILLRGNLTYTNAEFRQGPFAGNQVPLVAEWSGNVGLSWDVIGKWLVFDAAVNYVGDRRKDNDAANDELVIEDHTTVDVRLSGQVDRFFWSGSVQNLFNEDYIDYAVSSQDVPGVYNAYTLPGRTFMVKAGVTW